VKIVLVSAAWRRFDVTRLALAQRAHLCGVLAERGHEATAVLVADDENLDIAAEFGFVPLEQSNDELGRKFNDGFEYAFNELEADFVVHIGSDNWVHPDVFDVLPLSETEMPEPTAENPVVTWSDVPQIVAGTEMTLVDLAGARLRRARHDQRNGVIPWVIPRRAMERCGFRPVKETLNIGIDFSLVIGLGMRPEFVFHDPRDCARVDFKSDVNLNSFKAITGAIGIGDEEEPWDVLGEHYPAHLVEMARRTHEALHAQAFAEFYVAEYA
jgi:hypothetical protein